jgi:hypothetical protein
LVINFGVQLKKPLGSETIGSKPEDAKMLFLVMRRNVTSIETN